MAGDSHTFPALVHLLTRVSPSSFQFVSVTIKVIQAVLPEIL